MKKRVAFCMSGAMAKKGNDEFSVKNSLYNPGEYYDYTICFNTIKRHIFEANSDDYDFDIFCHSWNPDLEGEFRTLYQPKAAQFEDNRQYNDVISKLCRKDTEFSGVSRALSMKKSIELKEAYEKENGAEYDIVISYRYDVLLWKDIILDIYTKLEDTIYINADRTLNGDFHFIMNNETSKGFKLLYDSIETHQNYVVYHYWINNYIIRHMGKNVQVDKILPGKHQECIRKIYECSIIPGNITEEQLNSYRGVLHGT